MRVFEGYRVIETGLKHGTVTVIVNGEPFEITTYRIDGSYSDNRHPEKVTFSREITDDLSRRDFTINAMGYNHSSGLVDPFGGREDLKNRIIRTVGNPDVRFGEDALRILRCIRFASVLGFEIDAPMERLAEKHTVQNRLNPANGKELTVWGVVIDIDKSGKCESITQIKEVYPNM
jgi:tRNA nucleotidyltransferase (CCA-adding enzyme)